MSDLAETVYRELRAIARRRLVGREAGLTLQPTALVNEAWMKLKGHFDMAAPTPAFYKTAAEAMRQVLIDHARRKNAAKRGGGRRDAGADVGEVAAVEPGGDIAMDEVSALNEALSRLEKLDAQAAEVVKLRFFCGLSVEQAAAAMGISERTVKRDWQFARAWLAKELAASASNPS
jgi:RNA polymerase sigma factor (TIGR02999 family)